MAIHASTTNKNRTFECAKGIPHSVFFFKNLKFTTEQRKTTQSTNYYYNQRSHSLAPTYSTAKQYFEFFAQFLISMFWLHQLFSEVFHLSRTTDTRRLNNSNGREQKRGMLGEGMPLKGGFSR